MAVKDGLPATDFSKMNRDYIRNVAEGETVKDGLPATDFSRMNREYIKAVIEEAGGGGSSDFSLAEVIVTNSSNSFIRLLIPNVVEDEDSCIMNAGYFDESSPLTLNVPLYKGSCFCVIPFDVDGPPVTVAVTGNITWNGDMMALTITGNGSITLS